MIRQAAEFKIGCEQILKKRDAQQLTRRKSAPNLIFNIDIDPKYFSNFVTEDR